MAETARFSLPLILPGQAQKELFHNEALVRIDAALHAVVEDAATAVPPSSAAEGQCWIVAEGSSGEWEGRSGQLAAWTNEGWRYLTPQTGMLVWSRSAAHWIYFNGAHWSSGPLPVAGVSVGGIQVVGPQQPGIPSPSGGTIIDAEARSAIGQITAALMSHGLIA